MENLIDEPAEGLAPRIVEQVSDLISDRACVIGKGEIRHSGSIADLTADDELRKAYLAV